jgi:ankyrin repeat protein
MEDFVFFRAIREGNEEEVIRLLDADPTLLEREDDGGDRPTAVAAFSGQLGVTRVLIERDANINATGFQGNTALHYAAKRGYEEVVAVLLDKGAQANTGDYDDVTPLMCACVKGHLGVVKILVMGVEGLQERSDNGWTALHFPACWGHGDVVRFLLLAGADPTITDDRGRTPRALAEENANTLRIVEGRARCVAVFQVSPLTC